MDNTKKTLTVSSLQAGDIILFRNSKVDTHPMTWFELAIRVFTKSPVNHAAIVIDNGTLNVYEDLSDGFQRSGGVGPRLLGEQVRITRSPLYDPLLTTENKHYLQGRANSILGTKYDYKGIGIDAFEEVTGLSIYKPKAGVKCFFCSSAVAYILNKQYTLNWRDRSPGNLYNDTRNRILFEGVVENYK